jgi:hypothetical protein
MDMSSALERKTRCHDELDSRSERAARACLLSRENRSGHLMDAGELDRLDEFFTEDFVIPRRRPLHR